MKATIAPSQQLAEFAANLQFSDIPELVVRRAEDLLLDWFGSALAGKVGRPVQVIEAIASEMGPRDGRAEVLISRRMTSPLFAAMVNGASSHYAEQDDVHNGSVFHPAAVVFPAALAIAQDRGCSGQDLITAVVAGYEAGIRIGEFLGRSHYRIFHTTGTAGTVAAAVAAARLMGLNAQQTNSPRMVAIGNAAQTLHPVAGQGLNLGLRDAAVLANVLAQSPTPEGIHQFMQQRRSDRGLTVRLTDLMARVFASSDDQSLSQSLLGLSLGMIDVLPPARRALSEQMMFGWRS
jgi:hypothetical protein